MIIDIFILITTGILVAFLFILLTVGRRGNGWGKSLTTATTPLEISKTTKCPLCNSNLSDNKRVKSVLFPGKPYSIMEIDGCPYCYPANLDILRICPVCERKIPVNSNVVARVFSGSCKTNVHVLGCSSCYKQKLHR